MYRPPLTACIHLAGDVGDEVARVVEFLADPDSSYIIGQVYAGSTAACTCRPYSLCSPFLVSPAA